MRTKELWEMVVECSCKKGWYPYGLVSFKKMVGYPYMVLCVLVKGVGIHIWFCCTPSNNTCSNFNRSNLRTCEFGLMSSELSECT